jgi:toxin ParE1/3/4
MAQVHRRGRAKRDLIEHYVYLAEEAGIDFAERFLLNAEESFDDLARQPEMGVVLILQEPRLIGLRKWQVKGFEKFQVF